MSAHQPVIDSAAPQQRVDPVTASIIQGALENIAIEMGYKLMRMSYSSIIRESEDFGAAICDARGRQLCECSKSTPLQSGPIPGYVRGIIREFEARGDTFHPGDVIIHNDPYNGASHSPDIGFCVPIFHDGALIGFSMTTAHHLDIGSSQPGSVGVVVCADSYAEGLRFRALKVYDQGRRNDALWRMITDNVRVSDLVVGDMDAQIAACHVGARRLLDLVERYGLATLTNAIEDLFDYSERLMRSQIAKLKDGTYTATGVIDGFLGSDDPALKNLPIKITVTVAGSDLTIDLTGTAQQVAGHAINMPFVGTVDVALWLTLRSILLDTEIYGNIPQNDGLFRPIKIVAPRGCIANPIFPAPTIARFAPGNVVADTLMRALAPAVPAQVCAGVANLKAVTFTGFAGEQQWVHIEIFEGSYGGRLGKDGMDSVDTLYANTRNNPIEDIESHLPLRVDRYEIRDGTAAPGKWRGGVGSIRSFTMSEDGGASVEGEGHGFRPWGFLGGGEGTTAALTFEPKDGTPVALPSKLPHMRARAGDRFVALGPGGGGYGDPLDREPGQVLSDVLDGYITPDQALGQYGVVIRGGAEVDLAATEALRAARRVSAMSAGTS